MTGPLCGFCVGVALSRWSSSALWAPWFSGLQGQGTARRRNLGGWIAEPGLYPPANEGAAALENTEHPIFLEEEFQAKQTCSWSCRSCTHGEFNM